MSSSVFILSALLLTALTAVICGPFHSMQRQKHIEKFSEPRPDLKDDILFQEAEPKSRRTRNAVFQDKVWPNATMYYELSEKFSLKDRNAILAGMREISKVSCVKFKDAMGARKDYVNITGIWKGCYVNAVGYSSRVQLLHLERNSWCTTKRPIVHELLHALGFSHEHQRSDRDSYITINWDNIKKKDRGVFSLKKTDNLGLPYDPDSIMQYGAYAYAINRSIPTISVKPPFEHLTKTMRGKDKMSAGDIMKINVLYKCKRHLQKHRVMQLIKYSNFKESAGKLNNNHLE